jgi:hypothetical protein
MSTETPATETTKTAIENSVAWFLADKMQDAHTPIATKKYLTHDNKLVYLTCCTVAETSVPKTKVQILQRVDGGVHEMGYQIFTDHRMVKYTNDMIFGSQPGEQAPDKMEDVAEPEAAEVLALVNTLGNARQTL